MTQSRIGNVLGGGFWFATLRSRRLGFIEDASAHANMYLIVAKQFLGDRGSAENGGPEGSSNLR